MNDKEIRESQMITRMGEFGVAQAADFPATSLGGQKFAAVNAVIAEIDEHGANQAIASGAKQASTAAKNSTRASLLRQMRMIRDTAQTMEADRPGVSQNFRFPANKSDEALINGARAFIEAATPLRDELIQRELPATFLEDLAATVGTFESDTNTQNTNRERGVTATAAMRVAISRGLRLKRELDPIVRNKYRGNLATLAAWESATHIERAPKSKGTQKPPDTPTQ